MMVYPCKLVLGARSILGVADEDVRMTKFVVIRYSPTHLAVHINPFALLPSIFINISIGSVAFVLVRKIDILPTGSSIS